MDQYTARLPMPTDQPPTIDPLAAQRWAAMPHPATPWLHEEVARRMAERLPWIRLPVARWAHWEPLGGGAPARALVVAQYPDAECIEVRAQAGQASSAIKSEAKSWWRRLAASRRAPEVPVLAEPPEAAMQMVWANMLAHHAADPRTLMKQWLRALTPDGFVMFSCFGPDTLRELRALYADLGWPPPTQEYTDMHDWGDQLAVAGFADPVMDQERITLTFDSPARLLAELRELGRNLHPGRFAGLRTPAWRQRLHAALDERLRARADAPLALSFELIYGHALKPSAQRKAPREGLTVHRTRAALRDAPQTPSKS